MALSWVYVNRRDISRGIDTFSARAAIPDGFAEDLVNFDTSASGKLEKRRGYEGYYGWVPFRVTGFDRQGTSIQLQVAGLSNPATAVAGPVVVAGKLSTALSGDFSTSFTVKYYSTCTVGATAINVTDSGGVSASGTDTAPQLTVWGIDHSGAYAAGASAAGHVTQLDLYRREGEERLICGLGGALFGAHTYAESGTTYLMASLQARARATVSGAAKLAPLFHPSNPGSVRDRGVVYDTNVSSDYYAKVTAATYVSSGVVDYTLTWVSKTGAIADGGVLAVNYDKLTVAGLAHPEHTGSWAVSSVVSDSASTTVLRCANAAITSAVFDETGAAGKAGMFTDKLTTSAAAEFVLGDVVNGTTALNALDPTVRAVNSTTLYLDGITTTLSLANLDVLYATRTSRVVSLSNSGGTRTAVNMLRGDMLAVSGYDRRMRVLGVTTAATQNGTLSGSAGTVTVTTGGAHGLVAGNYVLLTGVLGMSGEFEVLTAPTSQTFTVAGTVYTGTVSVLGACVTLDESFTYSDASSPTTLQTEGRWIPLEAPSPATVLAPDTYTRYLDMNTAVEQPTVQSAMLNDSMYFTNGEDEVLKFDGTNITTAGLPKWQAVLAVSVNTAVVTGAIPGGKSFAWTSRSTTGNYFVMDFTSLKIGDWVYDSVSGGKWLVIDVKYDMATEDYHVIVSTSISATAATGTLNRVRVFKYYARLNTVDINGYQVASAALQSEDLVIDYGQVSGRIELRIITPPFFGITDYDRLELEIYRTEDGGSTFSRVYRQIIPAESPQVNTPYISVLDAADDATLFDLDKHAPRSPDSVMAGLVPSPELGTGWEPPPRASQITTLNNRLILGNYKGWPEADITFVAGAYLNPSDLRDIPPSRLTFRKDSASSATTTDMHNVIAFDFLTPDTGSFTFNSTSDVNDATEVITKANHGLWTGQKLTLTGTLPTGALTTSYAIRVSSSTFKLASSEANALAGTALDLTDAVGTCTVTFSDRNARPIQPTSIASGVVGSDLAFVVTTADAHGLSVGDWVYLYHGTADSTQRTVQDNRFAGWWQLSAVTSTTFSIIYDGWQSSSGAATDANRYAVSSTPANVPVVFPSAYDSTFRQRDLQDFYSTNPGGAGAYQIATKFAHAINACQRATTATSFTPWLAAYAGNDYARNQVVVRCPRSISTTPEVLVGTMPAYSALYINSNAGYASAQYAFETDVFPSRLTRSYQNYPEIHDSPYASDQIYSDSIIDVNPADGQEITGMIPFFGDSATGTGSQLSQDLLVFKTNSVYLVNIETRSVAKLNTRGQGCTASKSIAQTKDGVIFANEAGVFRINRDQSCSPVSKIIKDTWRTEVNKTYLSGAAGFHSVLDQTYKLSVPGSDETTNTDVMVYDYEREGQGQEYGAWTRYDNHPAVSWCAWADDQFFASTEGDVFKVRRRGEASDYRDEAAAIAASAVLRAEDFDLPGVRKAIAAVSTSVELPETSLTGLTVATAANLSSDFVTAGDVTLDVSDVQFQVFDATPTQRRGTHIQVKYTHSTVDEGCVLAGAQFTVAQLSGKRVLDTGDA